MEMDAGLAVIIYLIPLVFIIFRYFYVFDDLNGNDMFWNRVLLQYILFGFICFVIYHLHDGLIKTI